MCVSGWSLIVFVSRGGMDGTSFCRYTWRAEEWIPILRTTNTVEKYTKRNNNTNNNKFHSKQL